MATATESSGPRMNLVPAISSSPLPHTPLEAWAARTSAAVDGHSRTIGTPETPGPAMPGGFFTSPEEAQEHAKALREGSGGGKGVLDGEEVQRAMTNAAQRVKEVLPESVKAMLPSPSQSTLTTEAATPIAAPAPLRTATTSSAGTDLSTESQAGSLLPPAPSSLDVDTPRGSTDPTSSLLSAVAPTLEEDTASNLSTHVHTGMSNSPDAVAPMDPSSNTPSALNLPLPTGTGLRKSAGIAIPAPARTPSPGANGSRFAEDLHVDPPSNPDLLRDSLFLPSSSSASSGMVVSPEGMSPSPSPAVQRVREGARAPANNLATPSAVPAPAPAPAISISEYGGLQAGAPDVLASSGPEGVIPVSPTSPTSKKNGNSSSEDDGSGGSGVSANGSPTSKQKKSRLRRFKEKMHIGSGSS